MKPQWMEGRKRWRERLKPDPLEGRKRWRHGHRHRGLRRRLNGAFTLVAIFAVFLTSFGTLQAVRQVQVQMQRCLALEPSVRPAYCNVQSDPFEESTPNPSAERSSGLSFKVWSGGVGRSSLFAALISGALASLVAALMTRRITAPLSRLADAAQRLSSGERGIQLVLPRANDEIRDLTLSFNNLVSGLEKQEAWRRTLVADVAHDLRTPLAVMRAELEAMQDGVTAPDALGLERLHGEVLHLARLVSDLNTLSQAEGGSLSLDLRPLELSSFLTALHTSFLPRAERADMAFTLEVSGLIWVKADPDRLHQVLYNLLENAVQYAASGVNPTLELGSSLEGNHALIWVRDSGPGLAPEVLEQIFERFYRGDTSRGRTHPEGMDLAGPQVEKANSGLGLAIARALIRAQGGELWAENGTQGAQETQRGAVFKIRLARAEG